MSIQATQRREPTSEFADLQGLFDAQSIAVVGASADGDKIGGRPLRYLEASGYRGRVHPVNPKYDEIRGLPATASLAAIEDPVDVALIALPSGAVDAAIEDCIEARVPLAVVFSSGFAEVGEEGRAHQRRLVDRARQGGVRIVGPNGLGAASSPNGMVASFATLFDRHPKLLQGRIGFISQSGALGVFIYALAQDQGVGFSRFVSSGNEADLDVADFLAYMAADEETVAIGGYLEGIDDGDRFLAAAQLAAEAGKPMSFLKVGRSDAGKRAAASHTGSLTGDDEVYEAVFAQSGVVRASDPQGLIDFLAYHDRTAPRWVRAGADLRRNAPSEQAAGAAGRDKGSVAVLTISGGAGVFAADRLADHGVGLAELADSTKERLREQLPAFAMPQNPVDATGQILNDPGLFSGCLDALLDDPGVENLLVLLGLQERGGKQLAEQLAAAASRNPQASIAVAWLAPPEGVLEHLRDLGVAAFEDLARCVDTIGGSIQAERRIAAAQARAQGGASGGAARIAAAAERLAGAELEHEVKQVLADAGVAVPAGRFCRTREQALAAAAELRGPLVAKGLIEGVAHKTELGLVRLGLQGAEQVGVAYDELSAAIAGARPAGAEHGVLVEEMASEGIEAVIGCVRDEAFGFTVSFGLGGVFVEVMGDIALRIAPVDRDEALRMIAETKGGALIEGVRGGPRLDREALAEAIVAISELAVAAPDAVTEIEVNPLRVMQDGAVALDALVVREERS